MTESVVEVPDPRIFPGAGSAAPEAASLHALAGASLAAATGPRAEAIDRELRRALSRRLESDRATLAALIDSAPSVAIARHLWRQLDAVWREMTIDRAAGLAVTVFAIPLVVVAGVEAANGETTLRGVLETPQRLAAILEEHHALAGNRSFALADALCAADAIDLARLPELFAWQRLPEGPDFGAALPPRALAPAPLVLVAGRESVHLRFLVGSAVAKPRVDLLVDSRRRCVGIAALARGVAPARRPRSVGTGVTACTESSAACRLAGPNGAARSRCPGLREQCDPQAARVGG